MTLSTSQIQTDTWVKATWEEFAAAMDDPQYEKSRGYFDNGYMRIEMAPLGSRTCATKHTDFSSHQSLWDAS
ncbi:hypothetical protein XM38_052400 [Halomicronema hongdechloris C2206]|uniref:Uncharacterized protein n=1 Tax=Halomicronema hongdechloris C2206 TaxID=1641165 RepID=A0A1Z3HVH0_9CYAN|nr:hypothetical protein XM38_052400 [Halomicronema hongdechloris C2206]